MVDAAAPGAGDGAAALPVVGATPCADGAGPPRHLALVGMPGGGKSTVGPLLAARLGRPFVDLDAVIAAEHGPVSAIFAARGEAGFRAIERDALAAVLTGPSAVLALGGGAFADAATRGLARRGAICVWLDAPLDVLAARVGDGAGRPLLTGPDALARLLTARAAAYALADARVDASAAPAAVADAVVAAMAAATRAVPVDGAPGYEVRIGAGLLDTLGAWARALFPGGRAVVVTDAVVGPLHAARAEASLAAAGIAVSRVTVAAGEASKSWAGLAALCDGFAAAGLRRDDLVVALGGGVVGDLAGLAAALWMRGVRWLGVPTTLLGMVDSSVGGKTAIDLAAGKNLAGAFHDPVGVLVDPALLATLPEAELSAGYAEVAKYGLIDEPALWDWLEAGGGAAVLARDADAVAAAVGACVRAKARIVSADPREAGARALLNLGHTFGHAVEAETGFGVRHGEAVALGCALAFRFSASRGLCSDADAVRVAAHLAACGLPTRLGAVGAFAADGLVGRMRGDKKAAGSGMTLVLARGLGRAFVARGVDAGAVGAFLVGEGASSG